MVDDFEKGRRGEWSNVSDQSEYNRGVSFQRSLNSAPMFGSSAGGPTITGESPLLQGIVSIPFIVVGTLLYPITAVVSFIAALLCMRLIPLFGPGAGLVRFLAYIPMLVVFWITMRWDQRMGGRNAGYRRVRHAARLVVFAFLGAVVTGKLWHTNGGSPGQLITLPHAVGVAAGAVLGHLFLVYGEGWRDFWHRTLTNFRLRAAHGS